MASPIVLVTFLLVSVSATQACMCMPAHPQNHFCGADFVVRAHIINATNGPVPISVPQDMAMYVSPFVYTIRIVKIFKGEEVIKESKGALEYGPKPVIEASLYTPPKGNSCHFSLQTGGVYLLSGKLVNGKLRSGFCDWRNTWNRLTPSQLAGIRHNYSPNCLCQVGRCYRHHCGEMLKGCDKIEWFPRTKELCKSRYTFCKAVSDKVCQWVENAQYTRCYDDMP